MTQLPLTFTMLKIVLIASVVYLAQAQNPDHTHPIHRTHPPHNQGSPPPHGMFGFHYEEDAGELVMVSQTHCYQWALSDAQKTDIHDPAKIEALEFQLVGLASDTTKQTVLTGTQSPGHWLAAHCHNRIMVQVAA